MNIFQKTSSYRFRLMTTAYDKWLKTNERVLDIGCGRGTITKLLRHHYSLQLQACDIKNYLIYEDIPFKKMVDGKLPQFKHKFDTAFLNDVLHHIPKEKQAKLIANAVKIADKVLIFEMKPTYGAKIFDFILNKCHYGALDTPLSFRSIPEWKTLLKKLNVQSKVKTIKRPFWYPFSHIAFLIQK